MPIYEYLCAECGERFDKWFASVNRVPAEIRCPACQSTDTRKLVSAAALHTGNESGNGAVAVETPTPKPPIFGRKELNEVLENKK